MILRDVDDIKVGSTSVNKVYQGNYKVYDKNKIALEGYCKQNTTTGKQLLKNNGSTITINGVTFTKNDDGSVTANGTATNADTFYNYYRGPLENSGLQANTIYYASDKEARQGNYFQIYEKVNDVWSRPANLMENREVSFQLSENSSEIWIRLRANNITLNNVTAYPMITTSPTTATDYEPYTGGQPSPNPNYPQEIEVMEGRQVVNVSSENMIDILTLDVGYVGGLGNILTNDTTNGVMHSEFIEVEPNTTYRFKIFETSSNYPNWFGVGLYSSNDENTFIERQTMTNTSQNYIQITTTSTTNYIRVSGRNLAAATKIMLYKGTTEKTYVPYKSQDFEVDLESGNLLNFNVNQNSKVTPNKDGTITINGTGGFNLNFEKINLKAGTYYQKWELVSGKISGININTVFMNFDGSTKWSIQGEFIECAVSEEKETDKLWIHTNAIFDNAVIKLWVNTDKSDYEPYYNYKLAGIGDYKDNIYTKEGKWYLHKEIDKIVLDGSNDEIWARSGATTENSFVGAFNLKLTGISNKFATGSIWFCDKFTYGSLGVDYKFNTYNGDATQGYIFFGITIPTSLASDINAFRIWLGNNNVTLYYVLNNATNTEITSPTLIQQLNRLYQAM
jgi:hypothetical protein